MELLNRAHKKDRKNTWHEPKDNNFDALKNLFETAGFEVTALYYT